MTLFVKADDVIYNKQYVKLYLDHNVECLIEQYAWRITCSFNDCWAYTRIYVCCSYGKSAFFVLKIDSFSYIDNYRYLFPFV